MPYKDPRGIDRERRLAVENRYRARMRMEVLEHYGGVPPKCDCCGETTIQFLTLDHMNGDGNKLRKKYYSRYAYNYVRKNNYPKGFRVLCMNCNFSIGHYGFCPHNGGYC